MEVPERRPRVSDRSAVYTPQLPALRGQAWLVCSSAPGTLAAFSSWPYFPKLSVCPGFISGDTSSGMSNLEGGIPEISVFGQQWGVLGENNELTCGFHVLNSLEAL